MTHEVIPRWPKWSVAKYLLKIIEVPFYLIFMIAIGPILPMYRS